jgi:hypothetical protein
VAVDKVREISRGNLTPDFEDHAKKVDFILSVMRSHQKK